MEVKFKLYIAILRYPDGSWHAYSPDLNTAHQVGGNLKGDKLALIKVFIDDIRNGMLHEQPMDYLNAIAVSKKWLLTEGLDYTKVFIDIEDCYFTCKR